MISPEEFIKNFKKDWDEELLENVFMNGNCYHFALILEQMFDGLIIYDYIDGHFFVKIGYDFYDIRGKLEYPAIPFFDKCYIWDDLKRIDSLLYERILSDCVYKIKNKY